MPYAYVDFTAGPRHTEDVQLGDVSVGAFASWHGKRLHGWIGPNIYFPTGSYDRLRAFNLGRNYGAASLQGGVSYFITPKLDVGVKGYYGINQENRATHYQSGQELAADYVAAYRVSPKLRVGINGYYYQQITDDKVAGVRPPGGARGEAFAIGPLLQVYFGRATAVIKYQQEVYTENRAQGGRLWIQTLVPF